MGDVVRKHKLWTSELPRVEPFYGNIFCPSWNLSVSTIFLYYSVFIAEKFSYLLWLPELTYVTLSSYFIFKLRNNISYSNLIEQHHLNFEIKPLIICFFCMFQLLNATMILQFYLYLLNLEQALTVPAK